MLWMHWVVVGAAGVPDCAAAGDGGRDDAGCLLAGDVVELDFDAESLVFHGANLLQKNVRAFRDAVRVSAGSPPSHRQAESGCETRCGRRGGARGMAAFLLSFGLPARARGGKDRSAVGTHSDLSSGTRWGGGPGARFPLAAGCPGRASLGGGRGARGGPGGGPARAAFSAAAH